MRKVLPVLILISLEGQKEEADVLLRLFAFADSSHLARLRLPRFQRLILLFEISWASQRLSAQLNPGCYLLRLRRRPFGQKMARLSAAPHRNEIQRQTPALMGVTGRPACIFQ